MKVLMISGDPNVLVMDSATEKRMQEYSAILGELDILLCRGNIFDLIFGFFRGYKMMREKYDVITAQDMEHSLIAWALSKIFGVPWQMQIHTDIMSPYFYKQSFVNKLRVRLAKFLLPRTDGVRVVSERVENSIETWRFNRPKAGVPPP